MRSLTHETVTPSLPRRTRGFTLIEILVAVLVLSIGLLGLAGLQVKGLQFNQGAYFRSQATILAYDIIDRMRANRGAALAGAYTTSFDAAPAGATSCETATTACSAADMAAFDVSQWKCSLGKWDSENACSTMAIKGLLPEGDGAVSVDSGVFTVSIRWQDRDGDVTKLDIKTEL